jgi:integrase
MRKGEAAALRWKHLDRETWTVRLPARLAKTRHGRAIALTGAFRAIIERRIAARRMESDRIFHRSGEQIGDFRKAWKTACDTAGLRGKLFHDLRRTGVRNLVRGGVSPHVAMAISRHRTEAVFRRYDITTEDDLGDAADRVTTYVASLPETSKIRPLSGGNDHNSVIVGAARVA